MLGQRIRDLRRARGLTQVELAERADVSRQLVGAVEAGRHLPRVDAAMRLAAALSTTVEELLAAEDGEVVGVATAPTEGELVRIGRVGDRLVCSPVGGSPEGWGAADGVLRGGRVERFGPERPALVVAGCDPILGVASRLLEVGSGLPVVPVVTSSAVAAEVIAAGRAHAVTVHAAEGDHLAAPAGVRRWHVARWQVGLAAPAELPDGWAQQALAGRRPVIQREAGAGAQAAFERARDAEAGATSTGRGPQAASHDEAARRASTDGLVAVTIEPAALAYGLRFHALETHASQLWVTSGHTDDPRLQAFLNETVGERVHRRLAAVGGYDLADSGRELVA